MSIPFHGARQHHAKQHPVLDLALWEKKFPLGEDRYEGGCIGSPGGVAKFEQARRLAGEKSKLGPSTPCDVFVWSGTVDYEKRYLTQIGGFPWREEDKPWPEDEDGKPLVFLGQICFVDSMDIVGFKLPGEVALFFGSYDAGSVSTDGGAIEWSKCKLKKPIGVHVPSNSHIPFALHGVIHRTVQYARSEKTYAAFEAVGYKHGGDGLSSVQATSIGTYADLPQGWPFKEGDGNTLVCALSSFYFARQWPLCDVASAIVCVDEAGREMPTSGSLNNALKFGVGDAGCSWIYRDKKGNFKLDSACG